MREEQWLRGAEEGAEEGAEFGEDDKRREEYSRDMVRKDTREEEWNWATNVNDS